MLSGVSARLRSPPVGFFFLRPQSGVDGRALALAARAFSESRPDWSAAKRCWAEHCSSPVERTAVERGGSHEDVPACRAGEQSRGESHGALLEGGVSFRVASLRGGKHSFSSRELDRAIGSVIAEWEPQWHANLREPTLSVLCLLEGRRLLVGLLLPPFKARRSSVLPLEPRHWLCAGLGRSHMRPSRAAALVRLLPMRPGETLLDPCGGVRTDTTALCLRRDACPRAHDRPALACTLTAWL